jgi:HSP20 family molecular chaperone IbpA
MDIFFQDEPDLMGQELTREFDNLTNNFYSIFKDDLNKLGEDSELYLGIRSEIVREEVDVVVHSSSSGIRPKQRKVRRIVELVPVPAKRLFDNVPQSSIRGDEDSAEDIIINDKNVKLVSQLPINNKKENIKVVAYDDNSVTVSHLNSEGKRCTRTSYIPYNMDFEKAKAMYKNGILEIRFNRK